MTSRWTSRQKKVAALTFGFDQCEIFGLVGLPEARIRLPRKFLRAFNAFWTADRNSVAGSRCLDDTKLLPELVSQMFNHQRLPFLEDVGIIKIEILDVS